jgi:hypothetical protein
VKILRPDLKPSVFNIYFTESQSASLVYNSFSGRLVLMNEAYLQQIASGSLDTPATLPLSELINDGVVVAAEKDELKALEDDIERKKQRDRWADITFIASPTSCEKKSETNVLAEIERYCLSLKDDPDLQLVKLRFCGFATRPMPERLVLFEKLTASAAVVQKPRVGMWMTDQLTDIVKIREAKTQAYFLKLDLSTAQPPGLLIGKAVLRIKQLVDAGKAFMIQIEVRKVSDIEKHSRLLKQLLHGLFRLNRQLMKWDLAIRDNNCPVYYRPESCAVLDVECEQNKLACKRALSRLGIHLPPQIRRIHVHPGCPYQQENHKTFWWNGEVSTCLRKLSHSGPENLGTQKLTNPACRQCAYLPICAAFCPLAHQTTNCEKLKQIFNMTIAEGNLDFAVRN